GVRSGWKLHVSTLPQHAEQVLRRVVDVLKVDPAAFKLASDRRILDLLTTRNWPRSGGGKFITIYPADAEHFRRLGEALARATAEFDGPYILTDRRVPGSRVVFYRYGEHLASEAVDERGARVPRIEGPSGEVALDQRTAWYQLPEWAADPYGARPVRVLDPRADAVTLTDRYRIHGALRYTNLGGVYRATDLRDDRPVVIRERRPLYGWVSPGTDAVSLLHNEAGILRRMDGLGWTPGFVDTLQVWEHHYLVMEDVPGVSLRDFAAGQYLRPRRVASPRRLYGTFRRLVLELLRGIEEFHARGIILRDLTPENILVRPDRSLCFIDLEFAWQRDGEVPPASRVQTPGFASPAQAGGDAPTEADDFYALGAVLVEMCCCMAGGLGLNREGVLKTAEMMMDEVGLPRVLSTIARGLLNPDPSERWGAGEVRRAFRAVRDGDVAWGAHEPGRRVAPGADACAAADTASRAAEACDAVCAFLEASAGPGDADALWPASPQTHRTNPVSVLHGAGGPLEYVRRVRGACPDAWLDWVEERALPERCPPGLYAGLAGVALTLSACGRPESARRVMRAAVESPLLSSSAGLYYGAAGVGLAALSLGAELGDPALREFAVQTGERLGGLAVPRSRGIAWPGEGGVIPSGLALGGSGIALFYTYLGASTGQERYWELAGKALRFEFAQARTRGGYLFWPDNAGRHRRYWSPHVSFGAAGVGAAAARLYRCTGDPQMLQWAERCARALTFRWTNKLWQDMGYAGYGETFLDMYALTGDPAYREHALRMAEVLLPNQVKTRLGVAFPGLGWCRVSSDFGYGTSGIALFLHRLVHGGNRAFFPDHLIPGWSPDVPVAGAASGV
ncbi:MAG TPA: lanthionine synthetase LanC family protein, partial [Longimicrobium sp.]|nr:lanthionine synthetase LanC family protein [Longimicrobium sp.]